MKERRLHPDYVELIGKVELSEDEIRTIESAIAAYFRRTLGYEVTDITNDDTRDDLSTQR